MSGRLTPAQLEDLADELAAGPIARTERQAQPTAVLFAGQSGAGKSHVGAGVEKAMLPRGGCVVLDADLVRPALPYPAAGAQESQADAGKLSQAIQSRAVAARRNIVVYGTLRDPDAALETVQTLKAAGYRVELHALAVNDQVSRVRAAQREQRELEDGRDPRVVPEAWHEESYRGSGLSVRRLEYAAAVDRTVIYDRLGEVIHDAAPVAGQWRAGVAFDAARSQLTDYERLHIAREWDQVLEAMAQRKAPAEAFERVQLAVDRAHYTLRASRAAADNYDHLDPAARFESQERAERYGSKLVTAFRAGDQTQLRTLPELGNAFLAEAVGRRAIETRQGAAAAPAVAALRERIAEGLASGVQFASLQVREASAQQHDVGAAAR